MNPPWGFWVIIPSGSLIEENDLSSLGMMSLGQHSLEVTLTVLPQHLNVDSCVSFGITREKRWMERQRIRGTGLLSSFKCKCLSYFFQSHCCFENDLKVQRHLFFVAFALHVIMNSTRIFNLMLILVISERERERKSLSVQSLPLKEIVSLSLCRFFFKAILAVALAVRSKRIPK